MFRTAELQSNLPPTGLIDQLITGLSVNVGVSTMAIYRGQGRRVLGNFARPNIPTPPGNEGFFYEQATSYAQLGVTVCFPSEGRRT